MTVVATAGHVDHGKSTLVRALTGMEPDRWAEERRRGMTIDLGYAWTTLPSGQQVAFVDVPGHQRFIANMLAGIGPAAVVLFVVAADEGWCAQSEEHLAAIDALQIRHGLLAVTRADLADPEPARRIALQHLSASSLGTTESVAVSAADGTGLDELRDALDRLLAAVPRPLPDAAVRLWVDRAFTVRGAGTVVTGTLSAGTLHVDDTVELHGEHVRVRGLQSLGAPHQAVTAPARVAVNLRGVAHTDVQRGDVLLAPVGGWHHTDVVDVRLRGDDRLATELLLHVGTAAIPVRVRPLDHDTARLTLPRRVPLRAGDRGILRDAGRHRVAAGVLVLDADPPLFARRGAAAARAVALRDADGHIDARAEVSRRGAMRRAELAALGGGPPDDAHAVGEWLVAPARWLEWASAAAELAEGWAGRNPLDPLLPLAALARELGLPDPALAPLIATEAGLAVRGGRVLAGTVPATLGPAEDAVRSVEKRLAASPFDAPEANELAALGLGRRELAAATQSGRLLRLTDQIVLLPSAVQQAALRLSAAPQPFTTSQARQLLGTTRRVVIPLLEYLDAQGFTERDGDVRRIAEPS